MARKKSLPCLLACFLESQSRYEAILDSGTTLLLLPTTLFSIFYTIVTQQYPSLPGVSSRPSFFDGQALSIDPTSTWPDLHLHFGDLDVRVPPSVYFIKLKQGLFSYWYLGVYSMDASVAGLFDESRAVHSAGRCVHARRNSIPRSRERPDRSGRSVCVLFRLGLEAGSDLQCRTTR